MSFVREQKQLEEVQSKFQRLFAVCLTSTECRLFLPAFFFSTYISILLTLDLLSWFVSALFLSLINILARNLFQVAICMASSLIVCTIIFMGLQFAFPSLIINRLSLTGVFMTLCAIIAWFQQRCISTEQGERLHRVGGWNLAIFLTIHLLVIRTIILSNSERGFIFLTLAEDNAVWNFAGTKFVSGSLSLHGLVSVGNSSVIGPFISLVNSLVLGATHSFSAEFVTKATANCWLIILVGLSLSLYKSINSFLSTWRTRLTNLVVIFVMSGLLPPFVTGVLIKWGSLSFALSCLFLSLASHFIDFSSEKFNTQRLFGFVFLLGSAISWWPAFPILVLVLIMCSRSRTAFITASISSLFISLGILLIIAPNNMMFFLRDALATVSPQESFSLGLQICLLTIIPLSLVKFSGGSIKTNHLKLIGAIAFFWLMLVALTGTNGYGSKKVFVFLVILTIPILLDAFLDLNSSSRNEKGISRTIMLLICICLVFSAGDYAKAVNFGARFEKSLNRRDLATLELVLEVKTQYPNAIVLCFSPQRKDSEAANYVSERTAYLCTRNSSGFSRSDSGNLERLWSLLLTAPSPAVDNDSRDVLDNLLVEAKKPIFASSIVIIGFSPSGCSKDNPFGASKAYHWTQELDSTRFQAVICLPKFVDDLVNLY